MGNTKARQAINEVLRNTDLFPVNPNRFYDIQEIYAIVDDNVEEDIEKDFNITLTVFHHRIRECVCGYFRGKNRTLRRKLTRKPPEYKCRQKYIYAFLEPEPAK